MVKELDIKALNDAQNNQTIILTDGRILRKIRNANSCFRDGKGEACALFGDCCDGINCHACYFEEVKP